MKSLRALLGAVLLLSACRSAPVDPAASGVAAFEVPPRREGVVYRRVLAFGDWGTGSADQRRVAESMARRGEAEPYDFALTTGDNFYSRGVESADDPQWRTKFEQIYAAPSLQIPFYPSLGNHDHHGRWEAQVAYAGAHPNWRMPARYYAFSCDLGDGAEARFFALDTTPLRSGDAEQAAWLEDELTRSTARWKIVYGHHPLVSDGPHGDDAGLSEILLPLFTRHGVDLYLVGHDHILEMLKPVEGVNLAISGGGGGPGMAYPARQSDRALYAATGGGFTILRISRDEIVIEFVRLDGETQFAYTIAKP